MLKKKLFMGLLVSWSIMVFALNVYALGMEKKEDRVTEDDESTTYYQIKKVEEVVVTATLTPKALKDCSATVNVVTRDDIESVPASNALNILDHTPGIFVNRSGDFGRADVDIRGLGQNCRQVAVLVDGKPEKMGLFGCAVSHAFPLDNVDRIEVVKGPASVLYGGEAMGGAVNIITRMPQKKFETDITAFYGSYNTQQANVKHGANLDKFKYFLTFDRRATNGHIENADYSGSSYTGTLVYDIMKNTHIRFQGKYFNGLKNEPGTIDNPVTGYWNDYRRGAADFSLTWSKNKHEFSFKIYRNFGKHQFSDGWDSRDYTNGIVARFTTRGITNNELTIGGDIRFFGGKSFGFPIGKWHKNEGSMFVQNEFVFNTRWILSTGLRLQLDSIYGRELCPQMGLVFEVTDRTFLRAMVSKGFRSPQLNELYMFPAANPNLEPERVWNYEVGFEHHFSTAVTLKGSLFHMKGSNMIQTVLNNVPLPKYIFANTGQFSFNGLEVELDAMINRHLTGSITYSYLDTGHLTRGKAGQKIDFSLRFKKKNFHAALQGQYLADYFAADYSQKPIPSYFLLNARIIVSLAKWLDLLVDGNNILDKDYLVYGEFPGLTAGLYRMPGRNIQAGVRVKL
ncbi:MAG: TonB-dependent receptor [Acidobacteria bacterium]|jgi:iron complex outermembrane receptor protein|nr:TonB-dependent receptor [Acidobacteriota bacterium]